MSLGVGLPSLWLSLSLIGLFQDIQLYLKAKASLFRTPTSKQLDLRSPGLSLVQDPDTGAQNTSLLMDGLTAQIAAAKVATFLEVSFPTR